MQPDMSWTDHSSMLSSCCVSRTGKLSLSRSLLSIPCSWGIRLGIFLCMASDAVMSGCFLLEARHCCGPVALCVWESVHTLLLWKTQGTGRGGVWGPEWRSRDAVALGPATEPRLANGEEGSEHPKHGGKISVRTCSPLGVLGNIVVSDAMGKDVIIPIGIIITEAGMKACRDSQEVYRVSMVRRMETMGTAPSNKGFQRLTFKNRKVSPPFPMRLYVHPLAEDIIPFLPNDYLFLSSSSSVE